jgi:hypothetical protein
MSWVGFEPTILAFERAKSVHALDRAATVIDVRISYKYFRAKLLHELYISTIRATCPSLSSPLIWWHRYFEKSIKH